MNKHTPWIKSTTHDGIDAITDSRGINIVTVPQNAYMDFMGFDDVREEIIAAVNSHQAMKEALEDCINESLAWKRQSKPSDYPNEPIITTTVIKNAQKALTLANGKEQEP